MAQSFTSADVTQIIPGAVSTVRVLAGAGGPAAAGIVCLIGESEAGAPYTAETDLNDNYFGPGAFADVLAKYGSGPLVDGFRAAVEPLNDENVLGSPSRVILVKTNASSKASLALLNYASATWGTLYDKSYGENGNLMYAQVTAATTEAVPTTSAFTWIPTIGTCDITFRSNGGASDPVSLGAEATPASVQGSIDSLGSVTCTGGTLRVVVPAVFAGPTLALAWASPVATITYSGTWTTIPTAGDTMTIPVGSVLAGANDANVGAYVVTSAGASTIVATKLSNSGKGGAVPGEAITGIAVGATPVVAITDLQVWEPLVISQTAADPIDGVGKTLEICELETGSDLLSRACFNLSTAAVTWVSKTGAAKLLVSGTEHSAQLEVNRQLDSVSETFVGGGDIMLKIGCTATTATITISDTVLTTSVTGAPANLSLTLSKFPTIADLVAYINAQTGYTCAVGSTAAGQFSPALLDNVTNQGVCTQFGEYAGRFKADASKFTSRVAESVLVQVGNPATAPAAGLPKPMAAFSFLAGGLKGATTAAAFQAALTAVERVRCNFVVPLFSRDATYDIADALTDSGSTYTIAAIHSLTRSHCLSMSKAKRRKARQGMLSIRGTYVAAKAAAQTMASAVTSMSFLDQKLVGSDGTVQQLHPWADAAIAAGGQAACGYKALVRKKKNIVGSLQAAGDWNDLDDTQVEDALQAGLLPTKRHENNGSWYFVSDQTTYSRDSNFVWNSIQAVYVANTIGLVAAQRMEDAFAGQSVADVSAGQALAFLEGIMSDFMRLKLIAPSDDAPLGFRNAQVTISGPAMIVSIEVKLAGALYFININFLVSQVQQLASQA